MIEVLTFDPSDIQRLFEQDAIGVEYGAWPGVSVHEIRTKTDSELASFIVDLRNAMLLPLDESFTGGMKGMLAFCEDIARARVAARQKAQANARRYGESDWASYDLLAAVQALTGEAGKQSGREWWFRCPFHADKTPSFEVNAEKKLWHCHGACGIGGGVVAFRKKIE